MRWDELEAHVGQAVTLTGTAVDAAAGAIVSLDDRPVYVAGLRRWPSELFAQKVEVSGTLVFRERPQEAKIHRVDAAYALEDARWSRARAT
jgi:hypothetical protein